MTDWMITDRAVIGTSPMELPPICIDCGRERPDNVQVDTTLYWYPRWIWLGVLWGVFPIVLLYFAARRPLRIGYSLCEEHRRWRRTQMRMAYGAWAVFVAVVVADIVTHGWPPLLIALVVALVIAAVLHMMAWLPLRVAGHEEGVFGVRGFSKEFLEQAARRSPRRSPRA
jgi:hypothetical protein